jgi:hypothetical protein
LRCAQLRYASVVRTPVVRIACCAGMVRTPVVLIARGAGVVRKPVVLIARCAERDRVLSVIPDRSSLCSA